MSPPVYSYYTEEWNCWAASCASEWLHATIQGTQMHKFVCVGCEGFYLFIYLFKNGSTDILYSVCVTYVSSYHLAEQKAEKIVGLNEKCCQCFKSSVVLILVLYP